MTESNVELVRQIFACHELERRSLLIEKDDCLIHYTSAQAAVSIIRDKRIWMRNVRCMNDFMEVIHGSEIIESLIDPRNYNGQTGFRQLKDGINETHPNVVDECVEWYFSMKEVLLTKTYVTCLSEHNFNHNKYGSLSMWRSYAANQVGVGIVIDHRPLYSEGNDDLGAFSSPVYYFDKNDVDNLFREIAGKIKRSRPYFSQADRSLIKFHLQNLFRSLAICTKHPGFKEEKEWRIMHTEGLDNLGILERDLVFVSAVPQIVLKLPLEDRNASGVMGISIPDLFRRILIGPTQFVVPVRDALSHALSAAGVMEPEKIIIPSLIPLRTEI